MTLLCTRYEGKTSSGSDCCMHVDEALVNNNTFALHLKQSVCRNSCSYTVLWCYITSDCSLVHVLGCVEKATVPARVFCKIYYRLVCRMCAAIDVVQMSSQYDRPVFLCGPHMYSQANYTIGMFGKYLNVCPNTAQPGFDAWFANGGGTYYSPSFAVQNIDGLPDGMCMSTASLLQHRTTAVQLRNFHGPNRVAVEQMSAL